MTKLTTDILKNVMPEPGKRLEIRDSDEPGLIFRVTEAGMRTWSLRYVNAAGQHRRRNIGPYPSLSLAAARVEARKIKGDVAKGADVVANDRAEKAKIDGKHLRTIAGLAESYFTDAELGLHRANAKGPKRKSTLREERRLFETLIRVPFGRSMLKDISKAEVQTLVSKLSRATPSNGRHCRNVLRQLFSYAIAKGVIDRNPVHNIAVIAPRSRSRILTDSELRAFWQACERPQDHPGVMLSPEMALALRMAAVTLQRGGEVIGMQWAEIDLPARLWRIPAERMKGNRPHLVPLPDTALGLLDCAKAINANSSFVFPSPVPGPEGAERRMDRHAFSRAMNRLMTVLEIPDATPHDLRRTGATGLTSERIGIPRFIVSQVLAHSGDSGGAAAVTGIHYDLSDYLAEKRRALSAWAALLSEIVSGAERSGNVLKLPA